MISYAQNFEDVILNRALKDIESGFYIDIGAQSPVIDSVSLAFYEMGWRGVHCEPNPEFAEEIRRHRPDETVIQAAIGKNANEIELFIVEGSGLTTASETYAKRHEADGYKVYPQTVQCKPLSALLDQYADRDIHWLKIDVEGMEGDVLESWQPSTVRPWIVLLESTVPNSPEPDYEHWEPTLLKLGYEFVYFDGLNRFYVSKDHPELKQHFGPGPNVFDHFTLAGESSAPFASALRREKVEVAAEKDALVEQLDEHTEQLEELRNELSESGVSLEKLSSELETKSELLYQLEAEKKELEACADEFKASLERVTGERDMHKVETVRLEAESRQLESEKRHLEKRADELRSSLEKMTAERDEYMGSQKAVKLLEAQLRRANTTIRQQTKATSEAVERTCRVFEQQLLAQASAFNRDYADQKTQYESRVRALEHKLAEAGDYIQALEGEVEGYRQTVDAMKRSTSWRVSAPLRLGTHFTRAALRKTKPALRPGVEVVYRAGRRWPAAWKGVMALSTVAPPVKRRLERFALVRSPEYQLSAAQHARNELGPEQDAHTDRHRSIVPGAILSRPGAMQVFLDIKAG